MAPEISVHAALALGVAIFVGYFVFGMTGFGTSIIAVPLLAHALPLQFVVSLMVLLDAGGTLWLWRKLRGNLQGAEIKALVPFSVLGIAVGVTLLVKLPREHLLAALGVFSLAIGAYNMATPRSTASVSRLWSLPAGFAGGMFTALFGTGGPLYAAYLSRRIRDVAQFRATMSALVALLWFARIAFFVLAGLLLQVKLLTTALLLAPVMALGILLGVRAQPLVNARHVRLLIGAIITLAGISLLRTALLPSPA